MENWLAQRKKPILKFTYVGNGGTQIFPLPQNWKMIWIKPEESKVRGSVPSRWLMDNDHRISEEDFYNENLSEDDLKIKYK